jgi:hypothetical protein
MIKSNENNRTEINSKAIFSYNLIITIYLITKLYDINVNIILFFFIKDQVIYFKYLNSKLFKFFIDENYRKISKVFHLK